jgi:hypothetical protein
MTTVAMVAVTAVVAWARLGSPDPGDPAGVVEEMPESLAGGNQPQPVPDEVAAAAAGPVVGAARLERLPDHMLTSCLESNEITWDAGGPDAEYAFITTDGVTASLFGRGEMPGGFGRGPGGAEPIGFRVRCELQLEDGTAINRGGGGFEEVFPGGGGGRFVSSSCCDRQGLTTASAAIAVPPGSSWALQDRGGWFLAYDVAGLEFVGVSWKYQESRFGRGGSPQSRVTFLDDDGVVIEEAFAGGPF